MNGITMMIIAIVVLGGAYLLYGRYLQNKWGIDPKAKTPAYEMEDGVDYVPADTNVVFGHQFASIAGAGPINGPIQAAIFGWLPVLLWILIGAVIYLAFISLGLPDSLLGAAWPSIYPELGVPVSYAGGISMTIAVGTIISSLLSDRLTRRLGAGAVTA